MTSDHIETEAIHAGQEPDTPYGAVSVPIYQNSTFAQPDVADPKKWDYGRAGNPTREAFQHALAAVEGGARCFAFGSGMGAETTLLLTLHPGDHVLLADDVYGGTYRLLTKVFTPWGLEISTCDLTDLDAVASSLRANTRFVWVETPSNPLLKIVDIGAVAAVAHAASARVVVDNTFASPALQRPLDLGADVVVHSVTKYIGGHSDLLGGAIVANDGELLDRLAFLVNAVGAIPGPFDAFLALRGLQTLGGPDAGALRERRSHRGAPRRPSDGQPRVLSGFGVAPGHDVAARQMRGFGGMVSFRAGSAERAAAIARSTRLFVLAESLGGTESLIEVPGPMTHASVADSPLAVPEDLVRLSVGIEHPDDLVADLAQALG